MRISYQSRAIASEGFYKLSGYSSYAAFLIWVYARGGKTIDMGILSVAMLFPSVLLAFFAGDIVKRLNPKTAFVCTASLRCLLLVILPWFSKGLFPITFLAVATSLLQQFSAAAKLTCDSLITEPKTRTQFNSKRAFLSGLSAMLGPTLAGVVSASWNASAAVALAGFAGIPAIILYASVGALYPDKSGSQNVAVSNCDRFSRMIPWFRKNSDLVVLLTTYLIILGILEMDAPLVFPFMREAYASDIDTAGFVLGLCGLGALLGAGAMHFIGRPLPPLFMVALLALDGITLRLITSVPSFSMSATLFVFLGVITSTSLVTVETRIQNQAPLDYQPSLFSLLALMGGAGGATLTLIASYFADLHGAIFVLRACAWLEIAVSLMAGSFMLLNQGKVRAQT